MSHEGQLISSPSIAVQDSGHLIRHRHHTWHYPFPQQWPTHTKLSLMLGMAIIASPCTLMIVITLHSSRRGGGTAPQGCIASGNYHARRYDEIQTDVPRKNKCVYDAIFWDNTIEEAFFHPVDFLDVCARMVLSSIRHPNLGSH